MALAELSITQFTVWGNRPEEHETYKVILFEPHSNRDSILREKANGTWEMLYTGNVTSLLLPSGARIDSMKGPRSNPDSLQSPLKLGDYLLPAGLTSPDLRVKSRNKFVWITEFGSAEIAWTQDILEAVPLGSATHAINKTTYFAFSVRGPDSSGIYMVVNDDFKHPVLIDTTFRTSPLKVEIEEDGVIYIPSYEMEILPRLQPGSKASKSGTTTAAAMPGSSNNPAPSDSTRPNNNGISRFFPQSTDAEVINTVADLLNLAESDKASVAQAEEVLSQAIRRMALGQFPILEQLAKDEPKVKSNVDQLVKSLAQLWIVSGQAREKLSGQTLNDVMLRRMESLVEDRTHCELSLLTLSGPGSHAAFFHRGNAIRALNALYRRLNQ